MEGCLPVSFIPVDFHHLKLSFGMAMPNAFGFGPRTNWSKCQMEQPSSGWLTLCTSNPMRDGRTVHFALHLWRILLVLKFQVPHRRIHRSDFGRQGVVGPGPAPGPGAQAGRFLSPLASSVETASPRRRRLHFRALLLLSVS